MNIKNRIFIIFVILSSFLISCGANKNVDTKEVLITGKIEPKIKSGEDVTFYIATDIHYLSKSLTDGGEAFQNFIDSGDGKQLKYIDEITDAFINDIKKNRPQVLIISGDLTNNGEKKSHEDLAKKLKIVEDSGTSVYVIPGNHDILNPWAREFKEDKQLKTDYISDKDFEDIYGEYGYKEAISRDKNTLSYLSAPSEDVWLLMLDTCQYKDNEKNKKPQTDGRITDETYKWVEECSKLAKDNDAELVTVMHHNLMDHSEVVKDGFTLNDNQKAINNFLSNEIKFTLSGHIHVQDISSYKNPESSKKIYDITTGALSVYPQKYGVLKYSSPNKAFDYSTEWVNVEDWAKENKNTDTNLLRFKEYSKKAFGDKAADMAYINLADVKGYSIEQINLMSETFKELNLKYFEGTENIDNESILNSEGYKLWQTNPPGFLAKYIQSISSDKDTDDNNLHIDNK